MRTHRRHPTRRLLAHLSTAAALALAAPVHAEEAAVTVGILAPQGEIQAAQAWAQLAEVLHAALPERQFVLKHLDLPGLDAAVAGAQVDFFIANSGST